MDEEGSKAMILGFVSGCQTKEGASDDDVERLFNKTLPTTTEGKCLSACMMEEFGVVSHGGGAHNWVLNVLKGDIKKIYISD